MLMTPIRVARPWGVYLYSSRHPRQHYCKCVQCVPFFRPRVGSVAHKTYGLKGLRSRLAAHNDPTLEAVLASPDTHAIGCIVRLIR